MSKWQKYILRKFADDNRVNLKTEKSHNYLIFTVNSSDKNIKTNFTFVVDPEDDTIYEIHLNSGITDSYVAEYFNYKYSEENIKEIDHFLETPLIKGWKEVHYFNRKGTKLKTEFYYNEKKYTHHFKMFAGFRKKSIQEKRIIPILR